MSDPGAVLPSNDNIDLYKVLGVARYASDAEIKAAYKKLAVQFHPDRHVGDTSENFEEKFKEIGEAFQVLSNEEKRRTYDKLGMDGLKKGKVYKAKPPRDVFEAFFGDQDPYAEFQPKSSPFPTQPLHHPTAYPNPTPNQNPTPNANPYHPPYPNNPYPYPGQPHILNPSPRQQPPSTAPYGAFTPSGYPPSGYPPSAGYPPSSAHPPSAAYPPSAAPPLFQPGAHHQPQPPSVPTNGTAALPKHPAIKKSLSLTLEELFTGGGTLFSSEYYHPEAFLGLPLRTWPIVTECVVKTFPHVRLVMRDGKPTPEPKDLELKIGAGWKGGSTVTFPNEGDETPHYQPADMIIEIVEETHPLFIRDGNNLKHKAKVTLLDALIGVELKLMGLDGKEILVAHPEVLTPNQIKVIPNEGFVSHSTGKRGDLIVEFELLFPKKVTDEQKSALKESALKDLEY